MKSGDEVFYWKRRKGEKFSTLVIGRIRDTDGTYARVVALDRAPSAVPVQTVEISRLKPISELPPRLGFRRERGR